MLWQPPILNCVKCNIYGFPATYGGIFRDMDANYLSSFAVICISILPIKLSFMGRWMLLRYLIRRIGGDFG